MRTLLAAAIGAGVVFGCESGDLFATEGPGAHLRGSVFTTMAGGSLVDRDGFLRKEEVFLEGGRGPNAPSHAAGLAEGDYFFQVTDATGERLLSGDHISCRRVHVNADGVIDRAYSGTNWVREGDAWTGRECAHQTVVDPGLAEVGGVSVQLVPFETTPAADGGYLVWMIPAADYAGSPDAIPGEERFLSSDGLAGFHGFLPELAKSHSFTASEAAEPMYLELQGFHDRNVNGRRDPDEEMLTGWQMIVRHPSGANDIVYTPATLVASTGTFEVVENLVPHSLQTVAMRDGVVHSEYPTASPTLDVAFEGEAGEIHSVTYGNVGLGRVFACKHYDVNDDGYVSPSDPPIPGWEFVLSGRTIDGQSVEGIRAFTGAGGCALFEDLLPGRYTVAERMPGSGWYPTGPDESEHLIESLVWQDIVAGNTSATETTSRCLPDAAFDGKGYWHNKNGLDELTDEDLALVSALLPPFSDSDPRLALAAFLNDGISGDACERLAQQLLAFVFNVRHRLPDPRMMLPLPDGSILSAEDLIESSTAIWRSAIGSECGSRATLLGAFNEHGSNGGAGPASCALP